MATEVEVTETVESGVICVRMSNHGAGREFIAMRGGTAQQTFILQSPNPADPEYICGNILTSLGASNLVDWVSCADERLCRSGLHFTGVCNGTSALTMAHGSEGGQETWVQ